eukprot:159203_1
MIYIFIFFILHCCKVQMNSDGTSDWNRIVQRRYEEIYEKNLNDWIDKNGSIFCELIGLHRLKQYINKPYKCLTPLLKEIYNNENLSTSILENSSQIMFNWDRIKYINSKDWIDNKHKICPLCEQHRNDNTAFHIIHECKEYVFGYIWNSKNTAGKIELLQEIQETD